MMQKQAAANSHFASKSEKQTGSLKAQEKQRLCPDCATPIPGGAELCPGCGTYVERGHCSFCDFELEEDDVFCPECGNPRAGIVCYQCGTLNFRSFCSNCNTPLNELAEEALDDSAADPAFVRMQSLAVTLNEIDHALSNRGSTPSAKPDAFVNNLLTQYDDLLTSTMPSREKKTAPHKVDKAVLYEQKVQEMQRIMDGLKPEEGETPQMQRNYYSARSLPNERIQPGHVVGWECNYCRCVHRYPGECVYKELGGRWIYK